MALTRTDLAGLAVMGQNLALNVAEKVFPSSVYNRTTSEVDETVQPAKIEGNLPLYGIHDPASLVNPIRKPHAVIMLVKAGAPVDQTIATLSSTHLSRVTVSSMDEAGGMGTQKGGRRWWRSVESSTSGWVSLEERKVPAMAAP